MVVILRHHASDFGIEAFWNCFATSHGENACEGVGGMTKRQAASASLQRPVQDQILTHVQLLMYCDENITSVKYFFVSGIYIAEVQAFLDRRFQLASYSRDR